MGHWPQSHPRVELPLFPVTRILQNPVAYHSHTSWIFMLNLQRSPFQNPGIAIAKVLSMTAGSFEFGDTFRRDSSGGSDEEDELLFLPISYILWIIFVILMPVLLNNLLVSNETS